MDKKRQLKNRGLISSKKSSAKKAVSRNTLYSRPRFQDARLTSELVFSEEGYSADVRKKGKGYFINMMRNPRARSLQIVYL